MKLKIVILKTLPHLLIICLFLIISALYFSPVLIGKVLPQTDNKNTKGMVKEIEDFEKANPGKETLWTNSMFCGMPTYQVKLGESFNIFFILQSFFRLGLPYFTIGILFIYLLGFYFLMQVLGFNKVLSFAAALAFGFASYNIIIIAAGHITKAYAIGYMAPVIAGVILLYRQKYLLGSLVFTIALGLEISCSHPQITYYLAMLVLLLVIVELIFALAQKQIKRFILASLCILTSLILAIVPSALNLLTTFEYSKHTVRGGSELFVSNSARSKGLDIDYAMNWSYGKAETFTLLVPGFYGGSSKGFGMNSETYQFLSKKYGKGKIALSATKNIPAYWGDQPFTSGPVYLGSIICFLFIFGLFIVRHPYKWWLLIAAIISILLSWGKNFQFFTDIFFNYLPGYNKFRTVSMILTITNFTFVLMAFLAIKEVLTRKWDKARLAYYLKLSSVIVSGILVLFIIFNKGIFNYVSVNDQETILDPFKKAGFTIKDIQQLYSSILSDRASMLVNDALRSLLFIFLTLILIFAFIKEKIKQVMLGIILVILLIVDLWQVDQRFLNKNDFISKFATENEFVANKCDSIILTDKDMNYKVCKLFDNTFTEVNTSYFHKSIGGYHGAKLSRYQDLIDGPLGANLNLLKTALKKPNNYWPVDSALRRMHVINMLNTKYFVINNIIPLKNIYALGNAWFVPEFKFVENANEEYKALDTLKPRHMAVIDKKFNHLFVGFGDTVVYPEKVYIQLTSYAPNQLIYETENSKMKVAIFSEIYYVPGWNAYLDGKLTEHFRANYILRAMIVPPGKHKIEFKFEPQIYTLGKNITETSSIIIAILLIIGFSFVFISEYKKIEPEVELKTFADPKSLRKSGGKNITKR